ncbi:ATP synthase F0 subunit B [Corynebacterium sp. HMSC070H05]|nr:ATP synthase F0 subunit B [Corynebacterium sp. HMSC070H05]
MDGVRVQKNSFKTSLFVVYLPKSMCKEIPDYYTSEVDGREVKRPRYVARDYEEAKQYLEESMRWLAENFIPGGIDAVAGGDMNFDESTPHIQFQADTFSPKPEDPDKLRCRPGIAYNTDTSVRYTSGPKKGKQISGNQKFIDAQRGLREHMHSLGYPVELEVSERHDESLNLDRYTEQQDRERDLAKREDDVEVKKRSVQRDMDAIDRDREQTAKELEQAKAANEKAQGVLQHAEEQARAVAERVLNEAREKAEQEAEQIRSDAREKAKQEAEQTMGLAEAQADELLERAEETAQAKAGEITAAARSEAESITRQADEARKQAERDAETIRSEARDEATSIRDEATRDAAVTRTDARDEADQIRRNAHTDAEDEAAIIIEEAVKSGQQLEHLDKKFLVQELHRSPELLERYTLFKQSQTSGKKGGAQQRARERIEKRRQQQQQRDRDGGMEL